MASIPFTVILAKFIEVFKPKVSFEPIFAGANRISVLEPTEDANAGAKYKSPNVPSVPPPLRISKIALSLILKELPALHISNLPLVKFVLVLPAIIT